MEVDKVYCGDNLKVMESLESNSIDLIYCDILYGTGKNFGDYQDLKGEREIIDSFYKPRIKEMQRILKDNGVICIQMDYRISHWIRLILDECFGCDNFINEVIWHYSKMNATNNKFIPNHDNIYFYGKSKEYTFNIQYNENESALKQRLKKFIKNNKVTYGAVKNHKSQLIDNYIKSTKNKLGKDYLDDEDVIIDFDLKGKQKMDTVWNIPIVKGNSKENLPYKTQKPERLLEVIIKAFSNEGCIVADFFCGSGTTLKIAKDLNRHYIGCDINEKAVNISKERLK